MSTADDTFLAVDCYPEFIATSPYSRSWLPLLLMAILGFERHLTYSGVELGCTFFAVEGFWEVY